jgi:ribosomal protein S18 acetylase RimI-like enzyme
MSATIRGPRASYTIRRAGAADARPIRECLRNAFAPFQGAYTPEAFGDTVPSLEVVRKRIEEGIVLVAIRSEDDRVVGTLTAFVHGEHAHLRGMAVDAAARGQGIARRLLAEMESLLASRSARDVTLDVTEPLHRAVAVYEAAGFRRTGRTTAYFGMTLFELSKRLPSVSG